MASAAELKFAIRAINEASKVLKDVEDSTRDAGKAADDADGKFGGFNKALGGVEGSARKAAGALGDISKIAGGFVLAQGILKAPGFLLDAAKAAAEDEQATARLSQTVKNLGGDYDGTMKKVDGAIKSGQKLAFTDDEVRDSFQSLAVATGSADEALRRQKAAMDLARGANIPLAQATKMLGKMNEENVDTFRKLGIEMADGATEADALAAVQGKYAGQSEAYAKSTAGQFAQVKIRMGELKEELGAALLPVMVKVGEFLLNKVIPALEKFGNFWQEHIGPKVQQFVEWLTGTALPAIGNFLEANVLPKIRAFAGWFQEHVQPKLEEFVAWVRDVVFPEIGRQFDKFQEWYETKVQPAIDNIIAAFAKVIDWVREHWPEIWAIVEPVIAQVVSRIELAVTIIKGVLGTVLALLRGDWADAWNNIKDIVDGVKKYVVDTIGQMRDLLGGIWTAIGLAGSAIWGGIRGAMVSALSGAANWIIDNVLNPIISAYNNTIARLPGVDSISPLGHVGGSGGSDPVYGTGNNDPGEVYGTGPNDPGPPVYGTGPSTDTGSFAPLPQMAAGGLVKARHGGTVVRLGEGGEDEFVLPLSRMRQMLLGMMPRTGGRRANTNGDGGWGTGGIVININAIDGESVRRIVPEIAAELERLAVRRFA